MTRKLPWPFIAVISGAFIVGAIWGWKIIRDQAHEESKLSSDTKLNLLAPAGLVTRDIQLDFQRRERAEVVLTEDPFPSSLLRRALKSAPGQFDVVLLFHHQVSALRNERKLLSLYDSRVKFPTSIAPDFRKLPDDRNLMDTAPLLWGLLGIAQLPQTPATVQDAQAGLVKMNFAFWPAALIGLDDPSVPPATFAAKLTAGLPALQRQDATRAAPLSTVPSELPDALVVSHGSFAFPPFTATKATFQPLKTSDGREMYPLWIVTAAALTDGDLELSRKFVRFLLEPIQNMRLVQASRSGATTLRSGDDLEQLPEILQASHFRKTPIDRILIERDERVRQTDEILEQMILGADIKLAAKPGKTEIKSEVKSQSLRADSQIGHSHDDHDHDDEPAPTPKPRVRAPKPSPTPQEAEAAIQTDEATAPSPSTSIIESGTSPEPGSTEPSEQQPLGD